MESISQARQCAHHSQQEQQSSAYSECARRTGGAPAQAGRAPGASASASASASHEHAQSANGAEGPGLVCSETRGTSLQTYHLDPQQIRLRRLRRSVITASRLHQDSLSHAKARFRVAMLTLTYADVNGWKPHHIKELLRHIRQYLKRKGHAFRYVWVAELQQRGAVHYHVLIWLPRGVTLPKPDKRGWWPHGSTNIEWARKPVGYIAKYASKTNSKGGSLPKGIRLYGVGGLDRPDRYERSWWMLPQYIREYSPEPRDNGPAKRAKGGGWLTPFGEWLPSKFKIKSFQPLAVVELPGWPNIQGVTP